MTRRHIGPRPARRALVVASALLVALETTAGAAPPPAPAVVLAGPGGAAAGFASPVVLAFQGQAVNFVNLDTVAHTVTSKATRPQRIKYGKKWFTIQVPLFDSGSVGSAGTAAIKGVTSIKPGTYVFYCSVHTGMTGQLIVQAG